MTVRARPLLLLLAIGCARDPIASSDAGADAGAPPPPSACVSGRIELAPGQLGALGCYPSEDSGPITTIEVASPPPGITATYVGEERRGVARVAGNLRIEVADDAAIGERSLDVVVRGPGGEASAVLTVAVADGEPGIAIGAGAAEVALHEGTSREIPVRVVSRGGYAGSVALWIPSARAREASATLASASGTVAPGAPFETTMTVTAGYTEFDAGETLHVRAASGRHDATADVLYTLDPTPGTIDVWPTLGAGPLVARTGETARAAFDVFTSDASGASPAFAVDAPAGWTATVVETGGARALEVTPTAAAAEGGADVVVTAMLGAARWSGSVRVVRPRATGAWAPVGDGPLAEGSTETIDDGSEDRRALDPEASFDAGGIAWTVAGGGTAVTVMRAGGPFSTLDASPRSVLLAAITMPEDERAFVVAATGTGVLGWRFRDFGVLANEWDAMPALDTPDARDARPLAIAQRDGELWVAFGIETPIGTAGGPASIMAHAWDGTAWRGPFFASGAPRRAGVGGTDLAVAIDGTGTALLAWIDAADGAVHVARAGATGGPVLDPIAPSGGRVAIAVDVVALPDDRPLVLVHEASDFFAPEHPGAGLPARVRVLRADAAWTELADVTLPDVESAPRSVLLGLGASGAPRVALEDATGTSVLDLR